jgi:hypothetical protein
MPEEFPGRSTPFNRVKWAKEIKTILNKPRKSGS